jgi:hypothetical protein
MCPCQQLFSEEKKLTENLHMYSQAASICRQGWCNVALLQLLQGMSPLVGSSCHPVARNSPTQLLPPLLFSGVLQVLGAQRMQLECHHTQGIPAEIAFQVRINQSINQCYICSNEMHREFMPAIHRKSLIWLILTFATSPSKTTIQIAINSNLDTRIYS